IPVPDNVNAKLTRPLQIEAGVFSQQMALPWHADFLDCARGDEKFDQAGREVPVRIGWWPAQRPDDAFSAKSPNTRVHWARDMNGKPFIDPGEKGGYLQMAEHW